MSDPASPAAPSKPLVNRVPSSTYRLQLRPQFGLNEVRDLLSYLEQLGISDVYLSPLFRAREESAHGYDVVDHGTIDPAFGGLEAFKGLAEAVRAARMGILLDVVPNHMGINDSGNLWWLDVLENGESSRHADYFDIEWRPPASHLQHKVLLPSLGEPFGAVLEQAQLQVVYEGGRLQLAFASRRFPLAPSTWPLVLDDARALLSAAAGDQFPESRAELVELESIITQLQLLPPAERRDAESMRQRYREQQVAAQRLQDLVAAVPAVRLALDEAITRINGAVGDARSFDGLERLLDRQWYRLAYWRVASDEINYRRFFDINDLAAIRVEDPRVFDAVHRLVARFLEEGWVTGLRIDHPDGLLDPEAYFAQLQALYRQSCRRSGDGDASEIYIVAEKILSGDEQLPQQWRVCGTTGYDLLNVISRLLVDSEGLAELRGNYERLAGVDVTAAEVLYKSKRAVLLGAMASELHMLATQLHRCAHHHRSARDFTLAALERALREVIACMSVYRTYVRPQGWDVSETDYRRVTTAVRWAKRRNRTMPTQIFDFISSVLLLEHPATLAPEEAAERRRFALRMQQVTGPVTAKGVEDTAFYRYYPLASLNEVGGEIDAPPLLPEAFHRLMQHRAADWPHSMSASSTHDTKRGEDLRARLHVLSEIPAQWIATIERWHEQHRAAKADDEETVDRNAAYLLYQTLVGTWPLAPMDEAARRQYIERIVGAMRKSLREAKVNTSWMNPSPAYEKLFTDLAQQLIAGNECGEFRRELESLVKAIATAGFVNGLSQMLLKLTLPGVPDFYQGTELWDFNLVDPDNRRPVDFAARKRRLAALQQRFVEDAAALVADVVDRWPDPDVKLLTAWRALELRRRLPRLFADGGYTPLVATGRHGAHVVGFARHIDDAWALTIVPRLAQRLREQAEQRSGAGVLGVAWGDTAVELPPGAPTAWRNQLTGATIRASQSTAGGLALAVAQLLAPLPVALLTSDIGSA